MVDESGARRRDLAHNVERGADHQRRNALRLDHVSNETDGLMTEGSIGNEQSEIDAGFNQVLGDGRSELGFDFFVSLNAAHERKMER